MNWTMGGAAVQLVQVLLLSLLLVQVVVLVQLSPLSSSGLFVDHQVRQKAC
jgi:hypothetical protein